MQMFPLCLRAGAVVVPGLLRRPDRPCWPRSEGGDQGIVRWFRKVVCQMPECQVDHVAVVRVLFARCLREVEPEAMDQLNIVFSELGRVRPKVKDVGPAVRSDDAKAELTPRPVRHLFPGMAEAS